MGRRIALIQGHPDPAGSHFGHALASACEGSATEAGAGDMPARLKGFFEQVLRPGFAIGKAAPGRMGKRLLEAREDWLMKLSVLGVQGA